jgi:hypothetical protein
MIPTYEQLTSAPKIYLKMWSDLQPGDWVSHDGWRGQTYRVCNGSIAGHIGLDMYYDPADGENPTVRPYTYTNWMRLNDRPSDNLFYKVTFVKDYDPEQQPWEEGDI